MVGFECGDLAVADRYHPNVEPLVLLDEAALVQSLFVHDLEDLLGAGGFWLAWSLGPFSGEIRDADGDVAVVVCEVPPP